jgi:hypothetical protein
MRVIESRHAESPALFRKDDWRRAADAPERLAVHEQIAEFAERFVDGSGVGPSTAWPVLAVHALRAEETAWAVCNTGFAALALLDEGFFGKGIYFTHFVDYAADIYGKANERGECLLLLTWVLLGNVYPVTDDPYKGPVRGKGCRSGYQSHAAIVRPDEFSRTVYVPCQSTQVAKYAPRVYDELVAFSEAQCLPRYLLFVKKRDAFAAGNPIMAAARRK